MARPEGVAVGLQVLAAKHDDHVGLAAVQSDSVRKQYIYEGKQEEGGKEGGKQRIRCHLLGSFHGRKEAAEDARQDEGEQK